MELKNLKALAESFRPGADDKVGTGRTADAVLIACPDDEDVKELCASVKIASDGNAVRAILEEINVREAKAAAKTAKEPKEPKESKPAHK